MGRKKNILKSNKKKYSSGKHSELPHEVATDLKINYQVNITIKNNATVDNDEEIGQNNEVQVYQNDTYNQEEHVKDNQATTVEARNVEVKER